MPLIIITGLPSSGKTYRAQQIFADFQSRLKLTSTAPSSHLPSGLAIQHLTSSHASLDPLSSPQDTQSIDAFASRRDLIYNSAREEKTARAEEFSAAKRALSKNNIVILDAPNYIKGFRYQLWCEAKAVGTRSAVVHIAAREDECQAWNNERIKVWGWEELLNQNDKNDEPRKGPKVGRDVQGELQPESHTAIYGDRLLGDSVKAGLRSRSSSMGGESESESNSLTKEKDPVETMTLKSLYLADKKPNIHTNGDNNQDRATHISTSEPSVTTLQTSAPVVEAQPPSPKASCPYSSTTLRSLSMRYEPPSPFTRWDTPLFTVPSSDAHPPYQAIWDALFPPPTRPTKKVISQLRPGEAIESKPEEIRRHAATILPKATGADALQNLESATADVVKIVLATARQQGLADGEGGCLSFAVPDPRGGSDVQVEIDIPLNTMLSQPALQRLRRKYTQIQRGGIAHGQGYVSGRAEVAKDFSKFLEAEWNVE